MKDFMKETPFERIRKHAHLAFSTDDVSDDWSPFRAQMLDVKTLGDASRPLRVVATDGIRLVPTPSRASSAAPTITTATDALKKFHHVVVSNDSKKKGACRWCHHLYGLNCAISCPGFVVA